MARVSGKVVAVTGAGDGIGKATAKLFAKEGAKVVAISRTKAKVEATVADIIAAGGTAVAVACDLSTPEGAQKAMDAVIAAYGRVDTLVNAAGVGYNWNQTSPGSMNDTATTTPEKWREVMAINLDSVFYMCRLAIPHMQKQGGGAIVNIASIWGMIGAGDAHTYTATKGAIINFTRSLCVAYAKHKIRANTLCPGFIDTPMIKSIMNYFDDPVTADAMSPMQRAGTPEEMAYSCLFLGSDESSYCNGSVLIADGGTLTR